MTSVALGPRAFSGVAPYRTGRNGYSDEDLSLCLPPNWELLHKPHMKQMKSVAVVDYSSPTPRRWPSRRDPDV